jgi:methionyl-tRNA formyltransferase
MKALKIAQPTLSMRYSNMKIDASLGLYLMSAKGLAVLQCLLANRTSIQIAYIVVAQDSSVLYDGYSAILKIATSAGIKVYQRSDKVTTEADYLIAVSWRWLIQTNNNQKLIVFHDSLLPRYRGFAPLVNALINGESKVGVTALLASDEYDKGPIIDQESVPVAYPIKIQDSIKLIFPCYEKLALSVVDKINTNSLYGTPQQEHLASYSMWRDEEDYHIDWSWSAVKIQRFVDAVGFPYKGAAVILDNTLMRVHACEVYPDVHIENRSAGKVIFNIEGMPVVVCGSGLLKILSLCVDGSEIAALPLHKFRAKFK